MITQSEQRAALVAGLVNQIRKQRTPDNTRQLIEALTKTAEIVASKYHKFERCLLRDSIAYSIAIETAVELAYDLDRLPLDETAESFVASRMHFAIRTWRSKCKVEQERLPTCTIDMEGSREDSDIVPVLDRLAIDDWDREDIRQEAAEMMARLEELYEPRRRVILSLADGLTIAQIAREMRETQQVVIALIAEARYQLTGRVIVDDLL